MSQVKAFKKKNVKLICLALLEVIPRGFLVNYFYFEKLSNDQGI